MGFEETWADAPITDGTTDDNPPPAGKHDVALIGAGAFTSKAGNDVAKLEFRTVDRAHEWTTIFGFNSEEQTGFAKGQFQKVGLELDNVNTLDELDSALKEFIGNYYEVEVQHNGEYVNTYVREGQAADEFAGAPAEPVAAANTPDIPF